MARYHYVLLPLLLSLALPSEAYRLLGIFPHEGISHQHVFDPIMLELARRGHSVTVFTHFPHSDVPENYTQIDIRFKEQWSTHKVTFDEIAHPTFLGMDRIIRPFNTLGMLKGLAEEACDALLDNEVLKSLKPGQFDLAIVEQFNSDCALGVVHKLKIPFMGIASHVLTPWSYDRLGLISNPAFVPNHFSLHGRRLSFIETVENFILHHYANYRYKQVQNAERNILIKKYDPETPDLNEIAQRTSLTLVGTFFPLNGAYPVSPNLVEIGGVHMKKAKPLPQDIKTYLDKSTNGVIVFSMGSVLQLSSMPSEKLDAFKKVFSILPQDVLWKWENETMVEKPKNVKLVSWLPQADILRHKNVKAFITHGGTAGVFESTSAGVPMVVLPMLGDQFVNSAAVRDSGCGEVLVYKDLSQKTILEALKVVLSSKVQKSCKKLSEIWNDRQSKPLDTAIYWIEHVAKYGGDHLRPGLSDLPIYRYLLLDVICFMAVIILVTLVLVRSMLSKLVILLSTVVRFNKTKTE